MPDCYYNTDLELTAPFDLQPLADVLAGRGLMVLTVHPIEGGTFAAFETGGLTPTLESTVLELLEVVESLDDDAKRQWADCSRREFNIGYERSDEPGIFEHVLSPGAISRLAAVSASLKSHCILRIAPAVLTRAPEFL